MVYRTEIGISIKMGEKIILLQYLKSSLILPLLEVINISFLFELVQLNSSELPPNKCCFLDSKKVHYTLHFQKCQSYNPIFPFLLLSVTSFVLSSSQEVQPQAVRVGHRSTPMTCCLCDTCGTAGCRNCCSSSETHW